LAVKRGEVWQVNLDPTLGAEIQKARPCVIVSRDSLSSLPLKIIVPITEWKDAFAKAPWHVELKPSKSNGLSKRSTADTFQIRSISETRLIEKLGSLGFEELQGIEAGLKISLDL
jgi:mRNA interferase MazF